MENMAVHPTASDCLGYFANKLSVDSDALIKKIYANALLDKDSLAASHLTSVVMEAMKSEMNKYARNTLRSMTIPQVLKSDEQEAMKAMYPEYTLNFTNNICESHNFAHASRIIETILCMNKMSYFNNYKIRKKEIILKDIGGNRVFHALRGHTSVHVCAPVLSHVDAHRKATSDWRLSTAVASDADYYRYNAIQLMKRPGTHYCTNLGQKCSVKSPALMFIHSIYDMTPTEVADSMTAAEATLGMGTYIYDPRILMYDTGKLPLLNVVWRKYVKKKIKYIDFTFVDDAQPVYTHSLQVYMSYLETTYIVDSKNKNFYTFQFNENRNGIQFFTITRIDTPYVPKSEIKINHSLITQENFLMVTYYEWVEKISIMNRGRMRRIHLLVPTMLWEQAYDMLKQQSDGSFTVAKALEFMICYNKKTIINGQTVSHHQKCTSQVLDKLAYALYVRVYIDKYLASNTLTAILEDVNNVRELTKMGPIRAMYTIMKEKVKNFFFPTVETERTVAPYCAWATMSKLYKYPVDVRDAVTFKSVNTILPEIVQLHKRNKDFGAIQQLIGDEIVDILPLETKINVDNVQSVPIDTSECELFAGLMGVMPISCPRTDGKLIDVPGDGNCFFHSTIYLMNYDGLPPLTPHDMRNRANHELRTNIIFNGLDNAIKGDLSLQLVGSGGNQPVCILVCKVVAIIYRYNLCVHFHKNDVFDHTELYNFDLAYPTYHYHFNSYGDSSVGHFQPILYDKKLTSCNEVTCDAELQVINDESVLAADEIIGALSDYDDRSITNAKTRIQNTDILHGYVSNHVLPFISIFNDMLNFDFDGLTALDICSGPGGVSQYLIEQGVHSVVAVTDSVDGQLYQHPRVAQNYMDITDLQVLLEFMKVHSQREFDIVIADGCGPNVGYEFNRNLMICELMISLSLLGDGGNLVIRSWRYKYLEQCLIVEILQLHFADVVINRPYPLLGSDDVNYIICTNYIKPKHLDHMETFLGMLVGKILNSTVIPRIVLDDIRDYHCSLDTLYTFVRNPGLTSNNNMLKDDYLKLIPNVDIDSDMSGGVSPELRPMKLRFLTAIVHAMLNDLDRTIYPYFSQHALIARIGLDFSTMTLLTDGVRFAKMFYVFCKNLTISNLNDMTVTKKMTYKIDDKTISFMCESCDRLQFIPRCGGFYACACNVRNCLYVTVDDVLMSQPVLPCTCNRMIKKGAIINSTMDHESASAEFDTYTTLHNDLISWETKRLIVNSEYEKISKDLMRRLGAEMSDIVGNDDQSSMLRSATETSVDVENNEKKTIAEAMIDTIDTHVDKPIIEEDLIPDDGTTVVRLKKAFHECYNIWKMTDHNHTVSLKRLLNMVLVSEPSRELNTYLTNADSEPYVRVNNVWYPKQPTGLYMYQYDGKKYVEFNVIGEDPAIVSEYTRKKFEPTFIDKCEKYYKNLYKNVVRTKFDLVSGVPGCGKTTYIMKNHKVGDLVLSATREGAREFRKRASDMGESDVDKNYRTVYSYLYNSHDLYDTVYVDEAMMMHPGMMYAIICASRCKRLVMVGDVRQIPYYVRIDYDASYHKFDSVFSVTSYLHVSYRCPQDVAVLMRKYYDKFDSASRVVKSLNAQYISGKNDVPAGYDIYLTFSQSDKEILSTIYDNVNTIHEYQGKQAKRVALYRGSPTMLKLYDSIEHHIVALTRHTNTLTYYSVVQDSLYNSIANLKGGSLTAGNTIQYLTTSLFASNKYSIFHFTSKDFSLRTGIDRDVKDRIKNFSQVTINNSLGGLKYTYDVVNHRYIFHLLTHNKYTDQPELKYIKTAIYNLSITMSTLGVVSVHTSISYNGKWYDLENVLKTLPVAVIVHDPKGRYDRYRLSDIIVDYHHQQTGPNQPIIREMRERDLFKVSRKIVTMPSTYVLVYTDRDIADVDLQKKYHYLPITAYNETRRYILDNRVYRNMCVLMPKAHFNQRDYKCKKYSSTAFMKRCFRNSIDNLSILQQFNDNVLPNAYGIDTSLDVRLVALSDVTYHIQDCTFDASMIHTPIRSFDCVKPRLMTAMCPPRPTNSLKEVLKAVEKRNCAVPKIQLTMDVYTKATELYNKFIKYICVDSEKNDDIEFNKDLVEDWLTTQENSIVNLIQKYSISDLALNKYSLTIKKNSKPLLDMSCVNTYAALQTVVFSAKDFNTYFCPIFRRFKNNLMDKLVDKVLLMADMPPHRFSEIMSKQMSRYDMSSFYSLEIDVSKYDKSQALVHLLVDCFILRHFGVSDADVNRWFIGHVFTVLRDPSTKLTAYNFFQRKSGDPSTWILNTVQVLVMIINVIDVAQWDAIVLILASGDDSELISLERLRLNQKRFADIFNYEVKIYDNFRSIYFCSKFLIFDSNNDVYMIPDIYKMIKKLGRHDLKNREHLVSYRRSVLDGLKDFIVPDRVKIEYVTALSERYKCSLFSYDAVVDSLFHLSIDDESFEELYTKNDAYYCTGFGNLPDI